MKYKWNIKKHLARNDHQIKTLLFSTKNGETTQRSFDESKSYVEVLTLTISKTHYHHILPQKLIACVEKKTCFYIFIKGA